MKHAIIRTISSLLFFGGFLYLLGTAGASDLDMISNADIVNRSLVSLAVMSAGTFLGVAGGCFYA